MSNMKAPLPQCVAMVRIQNILSGKWKNNNIVVYRWIWSTKIWRIKKTVRWYYAINFNKATPWIRARWFYFQIHISRSTAKSRIFFDWIRKEFYSNFKRYEKLEWYTFALNYFKKPITKLIYFQNHQYFRGLL